MAISSYDDIVSLIEAWLPEDATLSGSDVTAWPGAFNSRTLTTPGGDPALVTAGLPSGSDSIELNDGSAKYLQLLEANLVAGDTFTFMAMTKLVGALTTDNDRVFSFNQTGSADWNTATGAVFHPFAGGPEWPDGFRNSTRLPNTATISADVWCLFMGIFDATNITFYTAVSGATGFTQRGQAGSTGTFDIDEFTIGADRGGGSVHTMELGDVVWYTDALDSTERQDLFDYAYGRNFTVATGLDVPLLQPPSSLNVYRM